MRILGRAQQQHALPPLIRRTDGGLLLGGRLCFALRLRDGGCSAAALVVPKGLWKATTAAAAIFFSGALIYREVRFEINYRGTNLPASHFIPVNLPLSPKASREGPRVVRSPEIATVGPKLVV